MICVGRSTRLVVVVVAALVVFAACGDDDSEPSAQDRYCAAGDELQASVAALADLDVLDEGANGVRSAVEGVRSNVDELRAAASDAAQEEIDALSDALDGAESALSDLGDQVSIDNASELVSAVGETVTAATAVYETLSDCP